jgi:small subunit ribosomal protein S1
MLGKRVKVKFLDVDEEEGKIVVSQRRAANELRPELKRGELVAATVTGLRAYGAFCEIDGGMSGLLHISQISSERIDSLEKLFSVGQKLKVFMIHRHNHSIITLHQVMVLDCDRATGRVALATKPLESAPGEMLRDAAGVIERAEETARRYHERVEAEKAARQAAANDIVMSLSGGHGSGVGGQSGGMAVAEAIESMSVHSL